jgi:hypothetical protein
MTMTLWPITDWLGKLWPGPRSKEDDAEIRDDPTGDGDRSRPDEPPASEPEGPVEDAPVGNDADRQASALGMLTQGQMILVRSGRNGSQRAEVVTAAQLADDGEFITVRKYRAKSSSWTKPVRCYAHQIVKPEMAAADPGPI